MRGQKKIAKNLKRQNAFLSPQENLGRKKKVYFDDDKVPVFNDNERE